RIGHGKSSALKEIRTIRYLEDEGKDFLPRVIQQLGLKQPLIIYGHSDGGTIALIYAASFPENVLAVISEAAHVFNEPETRNGILKMIGEYEAGDLPVKLQKFHGEKTRTMFYAWAMPWLTPRAEKWNIFNYLNDIQTKTLIVQGMQDPYATIKQVNEIKSRLRDKAVTVQFDQCGHSPHSEQKELVIEKTVEFLMPFCKL
ncbi:MAG: alpha/beta hydrolase, partial [Bacteroidota bacterium]